MYGENADVSFEENYGPCLPISTYGASKLACEALISAYCHMSGFKGVALHFANIVGSRQTHGVGYDFTRRLKEEPWHLRILEDGKQNKSYIDVQDVIEAMFLTFKKSQKPFDVYNAASEDFITVKEIADIAVAESGLTQDGVSYEFTGGDRGWKGDVPIVKLDATKIRNLGWKPTKNSAQAVRSAIQAMIKEIQSQ